MKQRMFSPNLGSLESQMRSRQMQRFTLLFLRGNVLERAEQVAHRDVLQAVASAAGQEPDITVEVWLKTRRVAVVRSASTS